MNIRELGQRETDAKEILWYLENYADYMRQQGGEVRGPLADAIEQARRNLKFVSELAKKPGSLTWVTSDDDGR